MGNKTHSVKKLLPVLSEVANVRIYKTVVLYECKMWFVWGM
jgi:hypothetical protein